jgi:hypothetical protein
MMIKPIKPRCRNCGMKTPPPGAYFCSNKCARLYAEELLLGSDEGWCGVCREWHGPEACAADPDGCPRCRAPLQRPSAEFYRQPHGLTYE